MTNEEAIKEFKERLAIQDYKEQIQSYYEAIEIAIKSLEENDKLKEENERLKQELEKSVKLPESVELGKVCYIYRGTVWDVELKNIGNV